MGMDRKIEKKKWPAKRIITYAVAGVFIVVVLYGLVFNSGSSSLNVKSDRITVSTVQKGPFQEFIPVISNVLPHNTIFLDAVEGGRVEIIYLRAGTQVKKGDKILKLSNTNLLMTLLNNEAQVNRASNELRATRLQLERNRLDLEKQRVDADYFLKRIKRKYERNKILFKEKFISDQAFNEFEDEYEYMVKKRKLTMESQEKDLKFQEQQVIHLDASVNQMQENLKLLKLQMDNLTLRAPISGHLTSLEAEVGQSKSPGNRLGQIDDTEGFKVRAEIDEHYISRIEVGKIGTVPITGGGEHKMKVSKVHPEVKEGKFEVDMEFVGEEPEGIRRGQTLHISLQLSEMSQALLVAKGGFYGTTGGNWAYVLDESGSTAVKRSIRLGRQNPRFFEILDGLKPGDRVITSSYENFGDMDQLVLK
ncbi:MAG: HlyD family efflux transporter periplasmic adaptor subunit [bacterium]|nr:HlyD family efflux transporter periplasmic adaptor subunit [bacterium]